MLFVDLSYLEVQSMWVVVTSTLWLVPRTLYQLGSIPLSLIFQKGNGGLPYALPTSSSLTHVSFVSSSWIYDVTFTVRI